MESKIELVQRVEFIKKICAGKKTLHLGCTNYPFTEQSLESGSLLHLELEKVAADLYGFDFDQRGIDALAALGSKNLYRADLERLEAVDFADTFDVIIGGEMIEHLSNPGLFLSGIRRFMHRETRLVITTINAYSAFRFLIYGLRGKGGRIEPVHPDHVAYYSYKTLSLAITRENLEIENFLFYDIGVEHRSLIPWYYSAFNDACVKIFPQFGDGVIAVCRLARE